MIYMIAYIVIPQLYILELLFQKLYVSFTAKLHFISQIIRLLLLYYYVYVFLKTYVYFSHVGYFLLLLLISFTYDNKNNNFAGLIYLRRLNLIGVFLDYIYDLYFFRR